MRDWFLVYLVFLCAGIPPHQTTSQQLQHVQWNYAGLPAPSTFHGPALLSSSSFAAGPSSPALLFTWYPPQVQYSSFFVPTQQVQQTQQQSPQPQQADAVYGGSNIQGIGSQGNKQQYFYPIATQQQQVSGPYSAPAAGLSPETSAVVPSSMYDALGHSVGYAAQNAASSFGGVQPQPENLIRLNPTSYYVAAPVVGGFLPPFAVPHPAPKAAEDLSPSFRGSSSWRARASLSISTTATNRGEIFFYQPSSRSDVYVMVTGVSASTNAKDIVILSSSATQACSNKPATNPVFNPLKSENGGIVTKANANLNTAIFRYVNDKISYNDINLWGSNTIVGRWVLIADTNANPGAGASLMCGEIISTA